MTRRLLIASGLLALAGCSRKPTFASEADELEYLKTRTNPTPEEWKRRKHLQERQDFRDIGIDVKPEPPQ